MTATRPLLITVFGGSGFVGRHVVGALTARGHRVRVAVRRPDLAGHVQPAGNVGQVMTVQANLRFPASVSAACDGADAVINLVGVLAESGAQSFDAIHAFGAGAVARAASEQGVARLVHMSAIGADAESSSEYATSKAEGERLAKEAYPDVQIVRPSIIFGPEDGFFNLFGSMARFSPVLPLIGGGETKFQPVYAGDVAEAIAKLVAGEAASDQPFELGGPRVASFKELMEYILEVTERQRLLLPIPFVAAKILALFTGVLPGAPLTSDQVELLKQDNVVSESAKTDGRDLNGLGVTPRTIESIVPNYLYRYRRAGQFDTRGA